MEGLIHEALSCWGHAIRLYEGQVAGSGSLSPSNVRIDWPGISRRALVQGDSCSVNYTFAHATRKKAN